MKIIDLLNKIAKGEEVPKKIKWSGCKYTYVNDTCKNYANDYEDFMSVVDGACLNDEIEIIEEKPKEIEFLGKQDLYIDDARGYSANIEKIGDKINELIRKVNYLLEKESDE